MKMSGSKYMQISIPPRGLRNSKELGVGDEDQNLLTFWWPQTFPEGLLFNHITWIMYVVLLTECLKEAILKNELWIGISRKGYVEVLGLRCITNHCNEHFSSHEGWKTKLSVGKYVHMLWNCRMCKFNIAVTLSLQ